MTSEINLPILLFGGTTEGRQAATVLDSAGTPFYYSTRDTLQQVDMVHGERLCGAMPKEEMRDFCKSHQVGLLIDATHPFANQVHHHILQTASELNIPVVRYDRQYLPHTDDMVWCQDFADFRQRFHRMYPAGTRLLAATGVQTIGEYEGVEADIYYRILRREQSITFAYQHGIEESHLRFYGEEDHTLYTAIVTKESGRSGGFEEKAEWARDMGATLFVIERPMYDPHQYAAVVDGPQGLRLEIERALPHFFPRRTGITTGTCATAAALAALTGQNGRLQVLLPSGEHIGVDCDLVVRPTNQEGQRTAHVQKYAGDDPDVTDGLDIFATVTRTRSDRIDIDGGEGIGIVTLEGLGLPVGAKAINQGPQQMIRMNLAPHLSEGEGCSVLIEAPAGKELARRTFNPRLGIAEGISIIGTSGIVHPFSEEAFLQSLRKCISVAKASGADVIVLNSGAKSEMQVRELYPDLPPQTFVQYGNSIGAALRMAAEANIPEVRLCLMLGKAVKLAAGHLDTHSRYATMELDFIQTMLREAQCGISSLQKAAHITLARELWTLLSPNEAEAFTSVVIRHCMAHCKPLLPHAVLKIHIIRSEK